MFVQAALAALGGCGAPGSGGATAATATVPVPAAMPTEGLRAPTAGLTATDGTSAPSGTGSPPPPGASAIVVVCLSIDIVERVRFARGSAKPLPPSGAVLDAAADILRERPAIFIEVQGHRAGDEPRAGLDEDRVAAVVGELARRGIDPARLCPHGYDATRPLRDESTSAGRDENRRVEFLLLGELDRCP